MGPEEVKPAMVAHSVRCLVCGNFPSRKCLAPACLNIASFQSALEVIMRDGTVPSQAAKEAPINRCMAASCRESGK
jgi:hypothetical protein